MRRCWTSPQHQESALSLYQALELQNQPRNSTILVRFPKSPFPPMLRVSRLTDYATVVMTVIATHPADVLSTAQIADEARLELPTVSKLLKLLGHAGLVESFRGVNGGYRLARPAEAISLADIVEALEGPIGLTECSIAQGHCERQSQCGVSGSWRSVSGAIDGVLRGMTLAQMLAARPSAPASSATKPAQANA